MTLRPLAVALALALLASLAPAQAQVLGRRETLKKRRKLNQPVEARVVEPGAADMAAAGAASVSASTAAAAAPAGEAKATAPQGAQNSGIGTLDQAQGFKPRGASFFADKNKQPPDGTAPGGAAASAPGQPGNPCPPGQRPSDLNGQRVCLLDDSSGTADDVAHPAGIGFIGAPGRGRHGGIAPSGAAPAPGSGLNPQGSENR